MAIQERVYDIDDLWEITQAEGNEDKRFLLIDGEIIEMVPPGLLHGRVAARLTRYLDEFVERQDLGVVTTETGYQPPDSRSTVLGPDVAYIGAERLDQPKSQKWVPVMPDIAVEVVSPSNTMAQIRRKAAIYLQHGAQLVWIVIPDKQGVEVCRLDEGGEIQSTVIGIDDSLSGESVLPGFALELSRLFK
ncbi:MAG: Uma2 family endonuclease [Chloroflexi bacterium]|nr:Uma2 family endonuclease [Chloroflexota bacterium]